ncbi:MAG: DNA-protecting protein DprA [Magnetococcales bacterium]|nr:DNA-protecting protein DprA [Magnetococcales bacterium]
MAGQIVFFPAMKTPDLVDWLRLVQIPGLGPVGIKRLLQHFGHPQAVIQASEAEYRSVPGIKSLMADRLVRFRREIPLQPVIDHLHRLEKMGARVITSGEEGYPPRLAQIYDPPAVLYVRGDPGKMVSERMVAVVGSRRASMNALILARKLCTALVQHQVTVVSGLALGVDSAAHWGALDGGGSTVAVAAVGLDICYPSANRRLADKIGTEGCLISEVPLGTRPEPFRFPARNRIISGLAQAVVVVEASEKSGALITARLALEQGREVLAVPGMAGDWRCKGSNQLLRDGAGMVEIAADILLEMRWPELVKPSSGNATKRMDGNGSSVMGLLMQCLADGPVQADELSRQSRLPVASLSSILLQMELAGKVIRLPGNWFALQNSPVRDTTS